jgi:3-hydroxyisobutyrate dehydrogenase-like beta-hydroxyacid dehydrogenase
MNVGVVGIAGTGRMGSAIGARLLERGVSIAVWNRASARTRELVEQGAVCCQSPAELAGSCDIVLTALLDDAALDDVYLGPEGLLRGDSRERLFINISTVSPATVIRLANEAAIVGASFVDAPVVGTVSPARAGQLIVMAGGSAADVARAKPLFEHIARVVHYVGDVGSGAAMKLAVNIPMATYWAAMAESFALAQAAGLHPEQLAEIIVDSPAAIAQLALKLPVLLGRSSSVGYDIDGVVKDCGVTRRLADSHGIELRTFKGAQSVFCDAARAGWGARDVAAVPRMQLNEK